MLLTCTLAVFSLMNSAAPICLLVRPCASSASTSASCGVNTAAVSTTPPAPSSAPRPPRARHPAGPLQRDPATPRQRHDGLTQRLGAQPHRDAVRRPQFPGGARAVV